MRGVAHVVGRVVPEAAHRNEGSVALASPVVEIARGGGEIRSVDIDSGLLAAAAEGDAEPKLGGESGALRNGRAARRSSQTRFPARILATVQHGDAALRQASSESTITSASPSMKLFNNPSLTFHEKELVTAPATKDWTSPVTFARPVNHRPMCGDARCCRGADERVEVRNSGAGESDAGAVVVGQRVRALGVKREWRARGVEIRLQHGRANGDVGLNGADRRAVTAQAVDARPTVPVHTPAAVRLAEATPGMARQATSVNTHAGAHSAHRPLPKIPSAWTRAKLSKK